MKKQLLIIAALCSSFGAYAKINEQYEEENIIKRLVAASQAVAECQLRIQLLNIVNALCVKNGPNFDELKEQLSQGIGQLKNIPDEETEENMMLKAQAGMFIAEFKKIAEVIRRNELPAINGEELKKGIDVQASRLKVVELLESLLK